MIKEGDKVVCIDDKYDLYPHLSFPLTKYGIYEVNMTSNMGENIKIKNDNNDFLYYSASRFITLAEYREQQINSILND